MDVGSGNAKGWGLHACCNRTNCEGAPRVLAVALADPLPLHGDDPGARCSLLVHQSHLLFHVEAHLLISVHGDSGFVLCREVEDDCSVTWAISLPHHILSYQHNKAQRPPDQIPHNQPPLSPFWLRPPRHDCHYEFQTPCATI